MSRSDWSSVFLSSVRLFVRACQPAKPAVGGRIFFFFPPNFISYNLELGSGIIRLRGIAETVGGGRCGTRQPEYIKLEWRRRRDEKQASSRGGDGWKCLARLHTSAFLAACRRDRKKKKKREEKKRKKAVYWLSTLRVSLKCNHNPNWPYLLYIQAAPGVAGALLFINI